MTINAECSSPSRTHAIHVIEAVAIQNIFDALGKRFVGAIIVKNSIKAIDSSSNESKLQSGGHFVSGLVYLNRRSGVMKLEPGLYEIIINQAIEKSLESLRSSMSCESAKCYATENLDVAESPKRLAQYCAQIIERILNENGDVEDDSTLAQSVKHTDKELIRRIEIVNQILSFLGGKSNVIDMEQYCLPSPCELLRAISNPNVGLFSNFTKATELPRPVTSIAQSSLFTGSDIEPSMCAELKKEIASCNAFDMLVSFIRWSGLRCILSDLKAFTQNGGKLRIITTTYVGATEFKAIEELSQLANTEIKISYDVDSTRHHAKAYIFHRDTGFSTAYIGSSNLSRTAIESGLEWNMKVTKRDLPEVLEKVIATFDSYWNDKKFEKYVAQDEERLRLALDVAKDHGSRKTRPFFMDIVPYAYQKEILDKLSAEREIHGRYKNLVVAATGTGKTVIAAFDYKQFRKDHPTECRLLFIVHRKEILEKSLSTFRAVLKDENFGALCVGGMMPEQCDYLFMSIQSFNSKSFAERTSSDYYDYIIIDEFHHAAASSYQKLLSYYRPKVLLGLTATPERMDGFDIPTAYFDGHIAAEIRLSDAIDRGMVCPFQYFGVTDNVDLSKLKWTRGCYDKVELSNIYTLNRYTADKRADLIVGSLHKYIANIDDIKGLCFCVSVEHAKYMADRFCECSIPALAVSGQSNDSVRETVISKLRAGDIKFICVVDLYNEGVDIPEINTILFLRPTESLTVFLQQLGRGLRRAEGKDCLTVLDFIGQANSNYKFESKFQALTRGGNHPLRKLISGGFNDVPKGCFIELERVAKEYILANIESHLTRGKRKRFVELLSELYAENGSIPSLRQYLNYYDIMPGDMYRYALYSELCVDAHLMQSTHSKFRTGFARLSLTNSRRWIAFLRQEVLPNIHRIDFSRLSSIQQRMFQMFYVTVFDRTFEEFDDSVKSNLNQLADSHELMDELDSLLDYLFERINFVDKPIDVGFDCPLDVHCVYTRDQVLVAMDDLHPKNCKEGVKWIKDKNCDILFVTLNKSEKEYSPTTLYHDYSLNETLFHWQSQSTTRDSSPTGRRYVEHRERGSHVLLFVRECKNDNITGLAAPYTFLGKAYYVEHKGSNPMNIIWELETPIPAKFIQKTNKLLAV